MLIDQVQQRRQRRRTPAWRPVLFCCTLYCLVSSITVMTEQTRGVLEHGDEVVGDRRNHDPHGLRNDDPPQRQRRRHAQRQRRFHLSARHGLQAGAIDLGLVGRVVDRQPGDGRVERGQSPGRSPAAERRSRTTATAAACRAGARRSRSRSQRSGAGPNMRPSATASPSSMASGIDAQANSTVMPAASHQQPAAAADHRPAAELLGLNAQLVVAASAQSQAVRAASRSTGRTACRVACSRPSASSLSSAASSASRSAVSPLRGSIT